MVLTPSLPNSSLHPPRTNNDLSYSAAQSSGWSPRQEDCLYAPLSTLSTLQAPQKLDSPLSNLFLSCVPISVTVPTLTQFSGQNPGLSPGVLILHVQFC